MMIERRLSYNELVGRICERAGWDEEIEKLNMSLLFDSSGNGSRAWNPTGKAHGSVSRQIRTSTSRSNDEAGLVGIGRCFKIWLMSIVWKTTVIRAMRTRLMRILCITVIRMIWTTH
ncbi:OLC1v1012862C1 [Oldenlandia corymbosa var. corymbosa]|uniref:OLC1v1012862C1 n=1 Tax=Oldenlandia corymbosa var. corymbosa TaxID=529605 RepID=A0AAV1DXL2_OLDCO|nr:OLC1v1012862C1 [Oldenlandia corymbosa var. corymbosa]